MHAPADVRQLRPHAGPKKSTLRQDRVQQGGLVSRLSSLLAPRIGLQPVVRGHETEFEPARRYLRSIWKLLRRQISNTRPPTWILSEPLPQVRSCPAKRRPASEGDG